MAIVREQGAVNSSTADVASIAVTLAGAATNGNLLVGTAGRRTVSGVGAITEPTGFTEKVQSTLNGTRNRTQVSYKVVSGDGTGPFTFTNASQDQEICATVTEWSGMVTDSFTGDTDSFLNTSTTETTTSISVDTTGTLSLLMFAMTHSDRDAGTFSGLGYSNSFAADSTITVDVDQNDVNHYTATKQVTSATTQACVASWTDTPRISSQCLVEFFGTVASGDPPVITVPGAQTGTFGTTKSVSGFSFDDNDDDVASIEASCESTMTITFDLSGTSVTDGSTNGTNAVVLEGTNADLATVFGRDIGFDRAELWPTYQDTNTATFTVIDDEANEDEDTVDITWTAAGAVFITSDFDATLQALDWTPPTDQSGNFNVRIVATTSEPLSDTEDFQFTVTGATPTVNVPVTINAKYGTAKAVSGISVTHSDSLTTSVLLECPIAMTMTVDAGATGATITGNVSNSVLIEDTHADINTVLATLSLARTAPSASPVASNLDPNSLNTYTISTNLQEFDEVYTDRTYTFVDIPSAYLGAAWIQTPNDDKDQSSASTLEFDLNEDAWVYVTLDLRSLETTSLASWLEDWEPLADEIQTIAAGDDVFYSLFRKSFAAGTDAVTLGGYDFGVLYSHYTVIILPIAATIPITVTATDSNGAEDVATLNVSWSVSGVGGNSGGEEGQQKMFHYLGLGF